MAVALILIHLTFLRLAFIEGERAFLRRRIHLGRLNIVPSVVARGGLRLVLAASVILVVHATGAEPVALRLKRLDRGADEAPRACVEDRHHRTAAGGGGDA